MSIRCDQARQLFSPLRDGELKPAVQQAALRHFEGCSECRERYQVFQDALHDLKTMPRHPVPRQFARDLLQQVEKETAADAPVEEPVQRAPIWRAAARWAAGVLLGITVVLVWWTWNPPRDPGLVDLVSRNELTLLERRMNQLYGVIESQSEQSEAHWEQLQSNLIASRAERSALRKLVTGFGERLSPERQRSDREELSRELLGALESRLQVTENRLDLWREDLVSWDGRMRKLERLTTQLVALGAGGLGSGDPGSPEENVPVIAKAPSVVAPLVPPREVIAVEEETRRYPAIAFSTQSNGAVRWQSDVSHPSYIASLFDVYDSESGAARELALSELDELFAEATAGQAPGREFGHWLLLTPDSPTTNGIDEEQQRVETYRTYWNKNLREKAE